ncbi:MAG: hypothetical protein WCP95_09620 [Actinomycetes bacterium]
MSRASATARDTSLSAVPESARPSELALADLRARRRSARSQLELLQLRARQTQGVDERPIELLKSEVEALTNELISRYESDLGLVDLILGVRPSDGEARP